MGVPFQTVEPRMSRDFLVGCSTETEAAEAARLLASAAADDGTPLFTVDNRGRDLFVELTWPHDIPSGFTFHVGNRRHCGLREAAAFVAIKNGEHRATGYFVDTGEKAGTLPARFPLADLPAHVFDALDITPSLPARNVPLARSIAPAVSF